MKRVILCRPEGPRNVGTILRVAANFGPTEITIVNPLRASLLIHPEFEQMSHGAEEARAAFNAGRSSNVISAINKFPPGFTGNGSEKSAP